MFEDFDKVRNRVETFISATEEKLSQMTQTMNELQMEMKKLSSDELPASSPSSDTLDSGDSDDILDQIRKEELAIKRALITKIYEKLQRR